MKAYKVTLKSGKAFSYITDEKPENLFEAIKERFGDYPASVEGL